MTKRARQNKEVSRQLSQGERETSKTARGIASTGKIPNATEAAQWRERFDGAYAARLLANLVSEHAVKTALQVHDSTNPHTEQLAS